MSKIILDPSEIEKFPKGSSEICLECRGGGIVTTRFMLRDVCNKCRGHGDILWINEMMGNHHKVEEDGNAREEAVMRNIQELVREIMIQYSKIGVRADFSVEFNNESYNTRNDYGNAFRVFHHTKELEIKLKIGS